ncbi:MAG: trypsin-like peptidase domain-containing protein [Pirellulales bacterium]
MTSRIRTSVQRLRWTATAFAAVVGIGFAGSLFAEDPPRATEPDLPKAESPQAAPSGPAPRATEPDAANVVVDNGPAPRATEPDLPPPAPRAPEPPAVYDVLVKENPEGVRDLRLLQEHVRELSKRIIPCTVGIAVGAAQGSGVLISADGYVLTAGHVSGAANRTCMLILHDGRTVRGRTLGANNGIDSGMIKIIDPNPDGGPWPHAEMGNSTKLDRGQWCLATGHPGGYQRGREPVVRLGRILIPRDTELMTDCTLVGGDSGGPLWDMEGRVIGINSRIGGSLTANIHVPVDTFRETWDRLAKAEVWGGSRFGGPTPGGPFVGVVGEESADSCKITLVLPDSPAFKAGIKVGDVIKTFGGDAVKDFNQLVEMIGRRKVGDKIAVEIARDDKTVKLELEIGKRPG